MTRLPQPGSDDGSWGDILNDFLSQVHNADGTLKNGVVGSAQVSSIQIADVSGLSSSLSGKTDKSTLTTKGDIYGATGAGAVARVGVGADGQALTADTTQTTGLKWATPGLQVFSVKDYGAAGDGTTDDQTAIQNTINAAQAAGGGIVFFPKGTYIVSGTPQITGANIIVRGIGAGSKILLASAALNASGTTLGLWVNGGSNVLIEKLQIDGNFANIAKNGTYHSSSTLWDPIISKYGANSVKNYVYAGSGVDAATYLLYRAPIRITDADNIVVQQCLIQNSISAGVLVDAAAVNGCTNISVTNCRIKLCWDNGIYFHRGVQYGIAANNVISDLTYNGVTALYSNHILIGNNNISFCGPSDSDSGGIQINGASSCSVVGNLIDQCQFYGIVGESTDETAITGGDSGNHVWSSDTYIANNYITDCNANDYPTHSSPGISLFGTRNTTISGNTSDGCDQGIACGTKAINTTISGNTILGSVDAGINFGDSTDIANVVITGNYIARNGSVGIFGQPPLHVEGNTIRDNASHGIEFGAKPSQLPQKIDYAINNTIADNGDSGVYANGGAAALAIIKGNTFSNSNSMAFEDGVANGTATFTSATAAFAASDVGRTITIVSQGTTNTTTTTTISSVTNGTTITLATPLTVSQSGLTFWLTRGPEFYADGATDGSDSAVLTSASAAFTTNDVGKMVTLYSLDPKPRILGKATISGFTSATQVVLGAKVGILPEVAFIINRTQGQQIRAINATSRIFDIGNTIIGMPELLSGGVTDSLVGTSTPGFPASGIVSYWGYDEGTGATVSDKQQTNPGTWGGTLGAQWGGGKLQAAGVFNGTDTVVDCGNDTSLDLTSALTISLWVRPEATQTAYASPIAKGGAYWIEGDGGGTNYYQLILNNGSDQAAGTVPLTANTWNHLAVTWDGTTAITYVNGVVAASNPITGTLTTNTNSVLFGNRTGFSRYFAGRVDEAGLWNRALSPAEILSLYNFGGGLHYGGAIAPGA